MMKIEIIREWNGATSWLSWSTPDRELQNRNWLGEMLVASAKVAKQESCFKKCVPEGYYLTYVILESLE
jgi:hypothetical protein